MYHLGGFLRTKKSIDVGVTGCLERTHHGIIDKLEKLSPTCNHAMRTEQVLET